jgi:MoxR-like ATPase
MNGPVAAPLDPTTVSSPEEVLAALSHQNYLADQGLATAIYLALRLRRPLLLEGEAGVGKTEVARALATSMGSRLIRLQCYEGIDLSQAVYEWDHARQLLHLRTAEATGELADRNADTVEGELYQERYLIRRPLLEALSATQAPPPVLLIDEVDRADDEFEAFLLEALSDYAVSVPELGTVRATVIPVVVLTSNRTRDVHDALKRRCLYHWVEHPDLEREVAIVTARAPEVSEALARRVAGLVASFRALGLYKPPGVAETIDWATALSMLGGELTVEGAQSTLGTVLKYREDQDRVTTRGLAELLAEVGDPSTT